MPNPVVSGQKEKKPIYFSMNMPGWFIDLDDDEKMRLVEKMAENSPNAHTLTDEELYALMPSSVK